MMISATQTVRALRPAPADVSRATLFSLGAVVAAVAILAGCETRTDDTDLRWVTVSEAQTLTEPKGFALRRNQSMTYVDPRSEKDFSAGHIPGAVLVPLGELREGAAAPLSEFDVLVVYDTDFDDVVAVALSKRLIEDGRWDVYTLTGGLRAWEKSGQEVAYGMPDRPVDEEGKAEEAVAKPRFGQPKKK